MHRKRAVGEGSNAAPAGSGNTKNNGASGAEINDYKNQIAAAIASRLNDKSLYTGKTCRLHIKLATDGMVLSVESEGEMKHYAVLHLWQ